MTPELKFLTFICAYLLIREIALFFSKYYYRKQTYAILKEALQDKREFRHRWRLLDSERGIYTPPPKLPRIWNRDREMCRYCGIFSFLNPKLPEVNTE
jgi:hypothetical protein